MNHSLRIWQDLTRRAVSNGSCRLSHAWAPETRRGPDENFSSSSFGGETFALCRLRGLVRLLHSGPWWGPRPQEEMMHAEDIEGLTIGGLLDLVAERRPDEDALVYGDRDLRYTYREFKEVVERCARALMALGIEKGDHVAVWGQNVPEWVTLQFATGKVGAVLVTINPAYKSHELEYVLDQSDAAALFLTEGVGDADFLRILQDAAPELATVDKGGLSIEGLPFLKNVVLMGAEPPADLPVM